MKNRYYVLLALLIALVEVSAVGGCKNTQAQAPHHVTRLWAEWVGGGVYIMKVNVEDHCYLIFSETGKAVIEVSCS